MPELPADKRALLERFDNYAGLRNGLRRVARNKNEWAGIPMPIDAAKLTIEPTYPKAAELMAIGGNADDDEGKDNYKVRNVFHSSAKMCDVIVFEDHDGTIKCGLIPSIHHFEFDLMTLGCSDAWGIEQESAAMQTLATLLSHRQMKHYLLTGTFLETSKRSNVSYMFRRLRPTVAMTPRKGQSMTILCCLCMHPIGYYQESWAGAMCPSDDVIAHLMLMRGDEKMFWRRCNQHPAWRRAAGL